MKIRLISLVGITLILAFSPISCSRKSGCPAEDVHVKTDRNGMPKAGKTSSGLLPRKASRKH